MTERLRYTVGQQIHEGTNILLQTDDFGKAKRATVGLRRKGFKRVVFTNTYFSTPQKCRRSETGCECPVCWR
jgi:hypothetical protein